MLKIKKHTSLLILLLFATQFLPVPQTSVSSAQTTTPIKHVVVIMMENHSFDNIFGLYPTMNESNPNSLVASIQAPDDVLNVSRNTARNLHQVPNGTYSTDNPDESVYLEDWNNGKMNGFASNSGPQSMTYYSSSQLMIEWNWAEEYAIGDRYFSSCLCQTNPNRLFSLAGYAAGITFDDGPPPYIPVNQTIFSQLSQNDVSWGYYLKDPTVNNFPLDYFSGIKFYSQNINSWSNFYSSLQNGSLPSVSWVMPVGGGAYGVDQHPMNNMTEGQTWLLGIVNNLMQSSYWNSTAIFITYDEGGGYYDQVPPPTIDGVQLGFRVPLFVISPYAKENYVSHTIMNHASILAFIDYNWHLLALNEFVADSGLPLDMFDFQSQPRGPVILDYTNQFPIGPQIPFNELTYPRQGLSTESLASMSSQILIHDNSANTPINRDAEFIPIATVVLVGALIGISYLRVRRHKT